MIADIYNLVAAPWQAMSPNAGSVHFTKNGMTCVGKQTHSGLLNALTLNTQTQNENTFENSSYPEIGFVRAVDTMV